MDFLNAALSSPEIIAYTDTPYRFFVALYHICLPHQRALIDLVENSTEHDFLLPEVMDPVIFDSDRGFCFVDSIRNFLSATPSEDRIARFALQWLQRIDEYLAGNDREGREGKNDLGGINISGLSARRLLNPNYYHSMFKFLGHGG